MTVTFGFLEGPDLPGPRDLAYRATAVHPLRDDRQSLVRTMLEAWSDVSGVGFVEVDEGAHIGILTVSGSRFAGWADLPYGGPQTVVFDAGSLGLERYAPSLILHEVGHALGLKHPFDGSPRLDPKLDAGTNTVMSYDDVPDIRTPQRFDIQAVQHYYGANRHERLRSGWDAERDRVEIRGTADDDVIGGAKAKTLVLSGPGHDEVYGQEAADTIEGGIGSDRLFGAAGNDLVAGGRDDDRLFGGDDEDTVRGGEGNDRINAVQAVDAAFDGGADLLLGGAGDDRIVAMGSGDTVDGGAGSDRIDLRSADATTVMSAHRSGFDVVNGFEVGSDELVVDGPPASDLLDLVVATRRGFLIDFGRGNGLRIDGVRADDAADVLF